MKPEQTTNKTKCSYRMGRMWIGIGMGIAIGAGIGAAMQDVAFGIGVGAALGAGLSLIFPFQKTKCD
jgi:hypothetical protein